MKKMGLIMLLIAIVGLNLAIAADVVTYENKKGVVTFDHQAHLEKVGDCAKCHDGEPAKIEVNKEYAHGTCKDCHKETAGPTKCNDCHKQ